MSFLLHIGYTKQILLLRGSSYSRRDRLMGRLMKLQSKNYNDMDKVRCIPTKGEMSSLWVGVGQDNFSEVTIKAMGGCPTLVNLQPQLGWPRFDQRMSAICFQDSLLVSLALKAKTFRLKLKGFLHGELQMLK